jgi:hypothetical protein
LWGSWVSLLELYPNHQQYVVSVLAPYIADQWKHHQDSFKKLCELFVGYHKTALAGSYNKNMPEHFGTFRMVTKKRKEDADISGLLHDLNSAALQAAVAVWRDQFGDSFLRSLIDFLSKRFALESCISVQPGGFNSSFAFNVLKLEGPLMLSAPSTPKSKHEDKIFKIAMDDRQLQGKRSRPLKRLPVNLKDNFFKQYIYFKGDTWDGHHIDFVSTIWNHLLAAKNHAAWLGRLIAPIPGAPLIQPGFLTYDSKANILHCIWLSGRVGEVLVFETKQLEHVELSGSPITTDF